MFFIAANQPQEPEKKKRLFDLRAAADTIPKAFKLVWEANPWGTIAMAVVTLLSAIIPASQAWVAKLIVDAVVSSVNVGLPVDAGVQVALPYLLLEFILITLSAILAECRMILQRVLSSRLRYTMNTSIIRQALKLDLQYFENAAFYDKMQNARQETEIRAMTILDTSFALIQNIITLFSFGAILISFSPLIGLILFGAMIPSLLAQMKYSDVNFMMLTMRAPETRRMHYFEHLLTVDTSVKEVKLFGLGEPLLKRYDALFWKFYRADVALAQRRGIVSLLWGLLASGSYYIAYGWIIWRTLGGTISIGDMTMYLTLFRQSQMTVQSLFNNLSQNYESARFMGNLFSFLGLQPQMSSVKNPPRVPHPIRHGIEFRNVSFKYPNRKAWALRDINLFIAPGEKLALVGNNGAGKTTFVKLLTRLYDPTEGQILLDGVDLREYDIDELRQRIGVIFQDFVRYHATARDNIGFGQINALDDQDRIEYAAQRGGADEVVDVLPQGYDTMLGTWFERGNELSGGQWQKIALARSFMRDGEVLVLDEPTAALDAEREYEIFHRFRELTDGKIALLISHRFSTVRMADRIVVIELGQVTEYGTHDELLLLDGTYAKLFNMQAVGYR